MIIRVVADRSVGRVLNLSSEKASEKANVEVLGASVVAMNSMFLHIPQGHTPTTRCRRSSTSVFSIVGADVETLVLKSFVMY